MSVETAPQEGVLLELSSKTEARDRAADEAEAARIIQELLQDVSPELIASFEPGFVVELYEASRDDGQSQEEIDQLMQDGFLERVQALTAERARLLAELQQFKSLSNESLEEAMDDPATYIKDAVLAFRERCHGRTVIAGSHYVGGQHQYSHYFATARQRRVGGSQTDFKEPELFMRIGYAVDSGGDMPEAKFFQIQTVFRRDANTRLGSAYDFHVGSNGELSIEEVYFSKGEYGRRKVTDRTEQYQLFQALVMDMHYELEHFDEQQDGDIKKLTKWHVTNQIGLR